VHTFADRIVADISNGKYPPLAAIVANAYYWNLLKGPEITSDGFDKTFEVAHVAHSALILRLVGSFGKERRVVLLSSDSHHPGKNVQETYPPVIPSNLDELIKPACDADFKGRGYQRYATTKLAITTWMYPLNRYLQQVFFHDRVSCFVPNYKQDTSLSKISVVAINPGKLADSRCMTTNTPVDMHWLQRYLLLPFLPLFKLAMGPTLRTAGSAAIDVVDLAVNPKYANKRGFYTMLQEDESAPQSRDKNIQESLWKKTLEWARITPENTALKAGL
jgi:NAD(P)-dependent dehydrogenase (short-subunit alcohol dehydrogenase family)